MSRPLTWFLVLDEGAVRLGIWLPRSGAGPELRGCLGLTGAVLAALALCVPKTYAAWAGVLHLAVGSEPRVWYRGR